MRLKFIIIILLQILLLTGIIAYRQYWVSTGERILLRTEPVDPRDIFRGDYVVLTYEISNLDLSALGSNEKFSNKERIYVVLDKDKDGTFRPASVSKTVPTGRKFIQGRAGYEQQVSRWQVQLQVDNDSLETFEPRWFSGMNKGDRVTFCVADNNRVLQFYREDASYKPKCDTGNAVSGVITDVKETKTRQLRVEYGIESYFVEEGKGRAIEAARNARSLKVEISLRKDGKGTITGLFLDNKLLR
jgi:uncharacterized membrane-anchored protein